MDFPNHTEARMGEGLILSTDKLPPEFNVGPRYTREIGLLLCPHLNPVWEVQLFEEKDDVVVARTLGCPGPVRRFLLWWLLGWRWKKI